MTIDRVTGGWRLMMVVVQQLLTTTTYVSDIWHIIIYIMSVNDNSLQSRSPFVPFDARRDSRTTSFAGYVRPHRSPLFSGQPDWLETLDTLGNTGLKRVLLLFGYE